MATTKNQGTCAVCMRRQIVWDGAMVLHGYQRPGCGWITGDCFGTRRPAWELDPEAAVEFVGMLRGHVARLALRLTALRAGTVDTLSKRVEVLDERGRYVLDDDRRRTWKNVDVARGEPEFAKLEAYEIGNTERDHAAAEAEVRALDKRIAAWKPAPLLPYDAPPPVEEKPVEIVWEPKCSLYVARRPGTTRSVGSGHDPAEVYAEANRKGWTLPAGTELPARVPTSERLRAVLGGRKPSRNSDVNRDRADCVTAARLIAFYDAADAETRRVIDDASVPQLLSFTRDTAVHGRVEGVNAPAAVHRLRLRLALDARPKAEQPATLLAGAWTRATLVDAYYAEPRTVTIERGNARLSENRIQVRSTRESYWFDWVTDVKLEA